MYEVVGTQERFSGHVFSIVTDQVRMPGGGQAGRDYMRHVGAVAVVALDDSDRIVLVRQYRHPVRRYLWELPAGLIDVAGEGLADAALRELAEEADLTASRVDLLVDLHTSPGCSNEMIRIFLARGLSPAPQAHERTDEEADLQLAVVHLDEALEMVATGQVTNGPAVAGILAAARARDSGYQTLRPADSPLS